MRWLRERIKGSDRGNEFDTMRVTQARLTDRLREASKCASRKAPRPVSSSQCQTTRSRRDRRLVGCAQILMPLCRRSASSRARRTSTSASATSLHRLTLSLGPSPFPFPWHLKYPPQYILFNYFVDLPPVIALRSFLGRPMFPSFSSTALCFFENPFLRLQATPWLRF